MGPYLLLIAQASAPIGTSPPSIDQNLPTLEIRATVHADRVTIAQQGEAKVELTGSEGAIPDISVTRSEPAGATEYRDLNIDYAASVTLDAPVLEQSSETEKTPEQQGD